MKLLSSIFFKNQIYSSYRPKSSDPTLIGIYHQIRFAGDVSHCSDDDNKLSLSQIANALAFLESQKYVHRDVAARNCLGTFIFYIITSW